MLRLAANISTLFTELPLLARPAAAAAAGFTAIEVQFPYATPAGDLARACADAQVECVLINIPAGDPDAGELGLAGLPGREREFAAALDQSLDYARTMCCRQLNCLAGDRPDGVAQEQCWPVLVANVRHAAIVSERVGVRLLAEPLNPADRPDHLLRSAADGDALLAAVDRSNLALQYDVYHRFAAGEDWLDGLCRRLPHIGHIQVSDFPGRHEPGTGVIPMASLFEWLGKLPYTGWVGCEYRPLTTTADSFGWLAALPGGRQGTRKCPPRT